MRKYPKKTPDRLLVCLDRNRDPGTWYQTFLDIFLGVQPSWKWLDVSHVGRTVWHQAVHPFVRQALWVEADWGYRNCCFIPQGQRRRLTFYIKYATLSKAISKEKRTWISVSKSQVAKGRGRATYILSWKAQFTDAQDQWRSYIIGTREECKRKEYSQSIYTSPDRLVAISWTILGS